jgi:hypothetical protein
MDKTSTLWSSNGASTSSSNESKFGTFLTRSVQDSTSHIVTQARRAGIKVEHTFSDGRGMIQMTGATEEALDQITLPAKLLESGVRTAHVSFGCVKVDFNSSNGTPISIVGGILVAGANLDPLASVSNEIIIPTTMNIASQKRRRDAYRTNSEYKVIQGSDADTATRSLADLYENRTMDSTGIPKTFSAVLWVYM